MHASNLKLDWGAQGASWKAAGHFLSVFAGIRGAHGIHFNLLSPALPSLLRSSGVHALRLLSTKQQSERKPNRRARLHNGYKCLMRQAYFRNTLDWHQGGTPKQARNLRALSTWSRFVQLVVKPVIKKLLSSSRHFSESACVLKLF